MPRQPELDALRGLAALSVLLHHNLVAAGLLRGWLYDVLEASPLRGLVSGRPAVLFFFVLSGYVLARSLRGTGTGRSAGRYARWVLQRAVRLGLPTLGALLLSVLLYRLTYDGTWPGQTPWLRQQLWRHPPELGEFLRQALLLVPERGFDLVYPVWSLVHEWRISLLIPALVAVPALGGSRGAARLVLVGAGLSGLAGGSAGEGTYTGETALEDLRATLYFLLPFLLGVALEAGRVAEIPGGWGMVAAALLAVAGLARVGSDLAIVAAAALLIWAGQRPGPFRAALRRPALVALGTVSFSLYLVHEPLLAALHHGLHDALAPARIAALSLAAALPAAWLFFLGGAAGAPAGPPDHASPPGDGAGGGACRDGPGEGGAPLRPRAAAVRPRACGAAGRGGPRPR
ncbi:acyltransferase family protein [Muricoccus nepalensis]|uniref:acyltransferase family protein n=1 Tax=Muricoccus nepalensis TaxID=1854500 RepID=UPI00112A9B6F|nr:acyltransferase [Roseomonas nepalensis]